jgi:hypothetical protein
MNKKLRLRLIARIHPHQETRCSFREDGRIYRYVSLKHPSKCPNLTGCGRSEMLRKIHVNKVNKTLSLAVKLLEPYPGACYIRGPIQVLAYRTRITNGPHACMYENQLYLRYHTGITVDASA